MSITDQVRDVAVRGIISSTEDGSPMSECQARLFDGEVEDGIERFEPYGCTARPHPGAEALVIHLDGDRSHPIVISTPDRRYRVTNLKPGEVCLYDDLGRRVLLSRSGITVDGADAPVTIRTSGSVTIDAPETTITGRLNVTGNIVGASQIYDAIGPMQSIRNTYNSHTHNGGVTPDQKM